MGDVLTDTLHRTTIRDTPNPKSPNPWWQVSYKELPLNNPASPLGKASCPQAMSRSPKGAQGRLRAHAAQMQRSQSRAQICRHRQAESGPASSKTCPILGPYLTNTDQFGVVDDRIYICLSKLDQPLTKFGRCWPSFGRNRPTGVRHSPD